MPRQYWGILAPNDHRKPLFRSSLLLFDQLLIPDSPSIANDLDSAEIDRLLKDVDYLSGRGVVQQVHWDRKDFEAWCKKISPSNPEEVLRKWPNCAARYYLQHQYSGLLADKEAPVAAFPVYLNHKFFDIISAKPQVSSADQRLILEVVLPNFPAPSEGASLDDILWLRESKSFQAALQKMRSWQMDVFPGLADDSKGHEIRRAAQEFERYVTEYKSAVHEIGVAKRNTSVVWAFSVGAFLAPKIAPVVMLLLRIWNPRLVSVKETFTPAWKLLLDKPFAPAGVIHEASQLNKEARSQ